MLIYRYRNQGISSGHNPLSTDRQVRLIGSLCSTWHLLLHVRICARCFISLISLNLPPALSLGIYYPNFADESGAQRGLLSSLESHSLQVSEPVIESRCHKLFLLLHTQQLCGWYLTLECPPLTQGSVPLGSGFPCL